jgi:hypothetical protein
MGYDNRHITELVIPEDQVAKANKLLVEYYKKGGCEYLLPGIRIYENATDANDNSIGVRTELVLYERCPYDGDGVDMPDELLDCAIFDEDFDDNKVGWLHNDNAVTILTPVIDYLRKKGVLISGWIFTDYEGTDVGFDFWVDGKHVYDRSELGAARIIQEMLNEKYRKG